MNLSYDFNGRWHRISHDEVAAIERSGPIHSVQHYAAGHFGRGYFDITAESLSLTVRLMRERPGMTEVGAMPIEPTYAAGRRNLGNSTPVPHPIHWLLPRTLAGGVARACDGMVTRRYAGARSPGFRATVHSVRACPRCVEKFNEHNR